MLERITKASLHQKELDAELAALIDQAVALGIGWPAIARHLGVTRQNYQRRHRDDTAERSQDDAA